MASDMGYIENRPFGEIEIGACAELHRTLTPQDVDAFVSLPAGADNRAQTRGGLADADTGVAHGMWGGALISTVLSTQLPGPGTIHVAQELQFHDPVGVGDAVTIRVEVTDKDSATHRVTLACTCTDAQGRAVITGTATVIAPTQKIRRPRVAPGDTAVQHHGATHDQLRARAQAQEAMPTAVVHPCDGVSLAGAVQARDLGLIVPILVGPAARITADAEAAGIDLAGLEIVDTPHSHASAEIAVDLVRAGRARALMKGALHTDEVMSAVVDKATGLRTERRMSHVYVMDVPAYPKPLLVTDAAINIAPDLTTKADIIQNAIDLAQAIGIEVPKVAILSAVETINPRMPSTVEAGALCKMADRGQIRGGVLDGPLAFDNAVSMRAMAQKGITSAVAGQADILLAPDLEAGNMIAKQLMYLAGAEAAGVVLGAQVPIILTSRADDDRTRVASAAIAALFAASVSR